MTDARWWERWPGRLEFELEALRSLGLEPVVDEAVREAGQIVVTFTHAIGAQRSVFTAVFPNAYPWFPFELFAPGLALGHHQNPFAGNLCLLARPGEDWRPSDNVAKFLDEQLPGLVAAGVATDASAVASVEAHQAEPVSVYYDYAEGSIVLVESEWALPSAVGGELDLGIEGLDPLRGAILELGGGGNTLATGKALSARFPTSVRGRWFRLDAPILEQTGEGLLDHLRTLLPDAARPQWATVGPLEVDVVGLVFPEEISWRTPGDGWVFLVRTRAAGSGQAIRRAGDRRTRHPSATISLARAGRYGVSDLLARVPVLAPLRDHMVSVIGLGGLGAPSALEFARAGLGTLGVLDGDLVEPGNGVRWPIGLSAAAWPKGATIDQAIRRDWPHTTVRGANWRLGAASAGDIREGKALSLAMDGTSLIYDASAAPVVQHFLADLAHDRALPYIAVWSTHGGWGGVVARIKPGADACWLCLQLALNARLIPHPPEDPSPRIQPAGCGSPTFTGTSFDLAPVWTAGVRLAISTLLPETYGASEWDVAVLSLRDEQGRPIMPTWTTHSLERNPQCRNHA